MTDFCNAFLERCDVFPSCVQWDTLNVTFRFHPNYRMFIRTGEALFVASAFDPVTYGGWDAGMLPAFLSRQDAERMNIAASEKTQKQRRPSGAPNNKKPALARFWIVIRAGFDQYAYWTLHFVLAQHSCWRRAQRHQAVIAWWIGRWGKSSRSRLFPLEGSSEKAVGSHSVHIRRIECATPSYAI